MRKMLVLVLATMGCGDSLLYVGVKADRICTRQIGETLPGTGAVAPEPAAGSIADDVVIDLGDLPEDGETTAATFELQSFRLRTHGDALQGLEQLRVVVSPPPGSSLPPIVLVDHPAQGGLVRSEDGELFVDLAQLRQNLADYLAEGTLTVHLEATGVLPAADWSADLEVCMGADAERDYGRELGL